MKESLAGGILAFLAFIFAGIMLTNENRTAEAQKQYTLDSLHYERQEAKQDSILSYQKAIYNDLRIAE